MLSVRDKLGPLIKEKRKRERMTQEDLADKLNVTISFIGQMERGEAMPSVETLQLIINELEIDPRLLFLDVPQGDSEYAELCLLMLRMNKKQKRLLLEFAKLLRSY